MYKNSLFGIVIKCKDWSGENKPDLRQTVKVKLTTAKFAAGKICYWWKIVMRSQIALKWFRSAHLGQREIMATKGSRCNQCNLTWRLAGESNITQKTTKANKICR